MTLLIPAFSLLLAPPVLTIWLLCGQNAPLPSHSHCSTDGIRSLLGVGNQHLAPSPCSALPPSDVQHGCTSIHFGENQLSPCSISISPLPTSPPPVLQHWWVRASTKFHLRFTLLMDSSHGFGSHRRHQRRISDSVSLWLPSFTAG